jgi:phage I-like protein
MKFRCWEEWRMEEENKRNEKRKCNALSSEMKADFEHQTSTCTERKNSLIENDRLKWKEEISIF